MINFLIETLGAITDSKHDPSDIVFIGSRDTDHGCTWEEFQAMADFEYEHLTDKIPSDLVIIFKDDKFLERQEDSPFVWWTCVSLPRVRETTTPIKRIEIDLSKHPVGSTLAEINQDI